MIKYALQSRSNTYLLDEWCFTGFYEFELVELEDTLRKIRPIYRRFEFRIVTILVEDPYERCAERG